MYIKKTILQVKLIDEIINISRAKSSKGARYSPAWLLTCLILYIRGPKSYNLLRDMKILPLPCKSTVMRYLKSSNTGVGFDEEFFKLFERRLEILKSKIHNAHHGTLCFDEMQVKTAYGVNVKTMSFNGLVDYGPSITSEDIQKSKDKKKKKKSLNDNKANENSADLNQNLADHALVFMYSSLTASFHQPIGVFATSSAAPCEIMAKLIVTAIIAVEKHGGIIDALVCDGAQNNRGLWKIFGIEAKPVTNQLTSKKDEIVCSFVQPTCGTNNPRRIFVISDVPHLFKCVRNNLYSHVEQSFEVK